MQSPPTLKKHLRLKLKMGNRQLGLIKTKAKTQRFKPTRAVYKKPRTGLLYAASGCSTPYLRQTK